MHFTPLHIPSASHGCQLLIDQPFWIPNDWRLHPHSGIIHILELRLSASPCWRWHCAVHSSVDALPVGTRACQSFQEHKDEPVNEFHESPIPNLHLCSQVSFADLHVWKFSAVCLCTWGNVFLFFSCIKDHWAVWRTPGSHSFPICLLRCTFLVLCVRLERRPPFLPL